MASSSSATVAPAATIATSTAEKGASNATTKLSASNKHSVAAIQRAFHDILKDPKSLDEAAHYMYQSLLDDAVVGVFLEVHHLRKTGNLEALEGIAEDDKGTSFYMGESYKYDIFGNSTAKKPMECTCPNCDRPVSAPRFATHLEKCMGMGRISSRIASRRLATKEGTSASSSSSSSYLQTTVGTDDEDDIDWSSEKRRKKNNTSSRNNGSKKNNGKSF